MNIGIFLSILLFIFTIEIKIEKYICNNNIFHQCIIALVIALISLLFNIMYYDKKYK